MYQALYIKYMHHLIKFYSHHRYYLELAEVLWLPTWANIDFFSLWKWLKAICHHHYWLIKYQFNIYCSVQLKEQIQYSTFHSWWAASVWLFPRSLRQSCGSRKNKKNNNKKTKYWDKVKKRGLWNLDELIVFLSLRFLTCKMKDFKWNLFWPLQLEYVSTF